MATVNAEAEEESSQPSGGLGRQYARGLNAAVTGNAQAFGFSITITASFAAISNAEGTPSLPELMTFAVSAVAAFTVLNLVVALIGADGSAATTTRTMLIGTATDFLAVAAGVGVAIATGHVLAGWTTWAVGAFGASLVYVIVQSMEMTLGRRETKDQDE